MLRIMIADDEERIRLGLEKIITKESGAYRVVGSYASAVELLEDLPGKEADVIITDIQMPGMDGLELIERLRSLRPEVQCVILSGYSEFEYARRALQFRVLEYLLKPVNKQELFALLGRLLGETEKRRSEGQARRESWLREKLQDREPGHTDEAADLAGKGDIACLVIRGEEPVEMEALRRWAAGVSGTAFLETVPMSGHIACLLFGADPLLHPQGTADLGRLLAMSCAAGQKGCLSIGQGPAVREPQRWSEAYKEALRASHYAMYGSGRVLTASVEEIPDVSVHGLFAKAEKELKPHLGVLDVPAIREVLQRFLHHLAELKPEKKQLHEVLEGTVFLLRQEIPEFIEGTEQHYGGSLQLEKLVYESMRFDQIGSQWLRMMSDLLEWSGERRSGQGNRVIGQVKRILMDDYQRDIDLPSLAAQVFLTPNYLSKLFKTETGQTLTEFLIGIRIQKAKELLKEHAELKTYEIGERVGYPDPAYFNKIFKKTVGFTPKEYRDTVR
ncbi:response regulator [Paenibacillus mucilaginosus]|uniref:Two component transcriptional regulator n=1 Tax=Paenibacillus mucilaginosus (strain KNP414) TaxID=1036673 RepID=F8F4V1_PAEMK|nr:response regulator [Paenibacillus mucilaginosus]AEI40681.1 two component transcriptional regulator [Paenibacillus mucilaginosus KNP414]MCG7211831.1 response regulator [Paenibacillus mucilaginosus]WDM29820.1 response regulator [Paenibacillus mucilaginosus]